jgi:hypothetical protein
VLNAILKRRDHARKAAEVPVDLERDDRDMVEILEEKLGDFKLTPLGRAAMEQARKAGAAVPPPADAKPLEELATQH